MDDTAQAPGSSPGNGKAGKPKHGKRGNRPRRARDGDVPPTLTPAGIERFSVSQSILAANESKAAAVEDILGRLARDKSPNIIEAFEAILAGASPDDVLALNSLLTRHERSAEGNRRERADVELAADWRDGGYPYKNLMSRRSYEREKYKLQVELLKLQAWVKTSGQLLDALAEDYRDVTTLRDPLDLARYLFRERGYRGADEEYYNPLNSALVHVLEMRRGLPISLVCIYMMVGRRLGMRIDGCNFPGHFLAFVQRGAVRLVVDCFDGGRVLDARALPALNPSVAMDPGMMKRLECNAATIVARVLRNLTGAYRQAGEDEEARCMEELSALLRKPAEGGEEA